MEKNVPDTKHSSSTLGVIDAYTPDFECGYCQLELALSYFHCNVSRVCFEYVWVTCKTSAVVKHLTSLGFLFARHAPPSADFMICASCHQAGYYRLSRDLDGMWPRNITALLEEGFFTPSFRQRDKDEIWARWARMEVVDISLMSNYYKATTTQQTAIVLGSYGTPDHQAWSPIQYCTTYPSIPRDTLAPHQSSLGYCNWRTSSMTTKKMTGRKCK
jgi:hypothetical protein